MTDVYPGIDDWDREVLDLLPGPARAGPGRAFALGLLSPLADIELQIESVARELADVEVAGLYIAGSLARRYGVDPTGLPLIEVRRLAAAGAAALACDGTDARIWAVWTALIGGTTATVRPLVSSTSYGVILQGQITWQPSQGWLAQAAAIVRRCVDLGAEVEATVYLGGTIRLDGTPALDAGVLAYALPV